MTLTEALARRRNGVFFCDGPIAPACRLATPPARHVLLHGAENRAGLLTAIGRTLRLPDWFGHNWDALEESLLDLPLGTGGLVLELSGVEALGRDDPASFRTLIDILEAAARQWDDQGVRFLAVITGTRPAGSALESLDPA
jgi:hypothetical protein